MNSYLISSSKKSSGKTILSIGICSAIHSFKKVVAPFNTVEIDSKIYDLKINVDGGGYKGQAEAIRMAIARALVKLNEDFRKIPDA